MYQEFYGEETHKLTPHIVNVHENSINVHDIIMDYLTEITSVHTWGMPFYVINEIIKEDILHIVHQNLIMQLHM